MLGAIGLAVIVALGVGLGVKVLGSDDGLRLRAGRAHGDPDAQRVVRYGPTGAPTAPAESVLVAEESFQRGPGPFGMGDLPVNDGGHDARGARQGAYRVGVRGIGAGWDSWNFVELAASPRPVVGDDPGRQCGRVLRGDGR